MPTFALSQVVIDGGSGSSEFKGEFSVADLGFCEGGSYNKNARVSTRKI